VRGGRGGGGMHMRGHEHGIHWGLRKEKEARGGGAIGHATWTLGLVAGGLCR